MNTKDKTPRKVALVRTSILVAHETDKALRQLAEDGKRPLSWEIRQALEDHVDKCSERVAA